MRSRVLVGAAAWLLGAVTATTGSMIAVNHLAHGLFGQPAQLLGSAAADLDHDSGGQPAANHAALIPSYSSANARSGRDTPAQDLYGSNGSGSGAGSSSTGGTLLVSADGRVGAECLQAGAYLLYWVPNQGFQADDVRRGPAPVASLTFQGGGFNSNLVMRVFCRAGTPVAHIFRDE